MSEVEEPGRQLGDILAAQDAPAPLASARPVQDAWFPRPFDSIVRSLAEQHGEDPAEVLREMRGNSALARTLRKALSMIDMSADMRVCLMRRTWDRSTKTREQHDAAIAAFLNAETDAAGVRLHNVTAASIKTMASRGRREFEREIASRGYQSIADMFDPDWSRNTGSTKEG